MSSRSCPSHAFIVSRWVNFHNFLRRRSPETALSNRHLGEHVCCRGILCLKRRSAFTFARRYEVLFLLVKSFSFFETQFRCQQPHPIDSQDTHMLVSELKPTLRFKIMQCASTQNTENNVRGRWMGGSLRSFSHKDDFRFYSRPNAARQAKCVLRSFALAWNKNFYFLIESGKRLLWLWLIRHGPTMEWQVQVQK